MRMCVDYRDLNKASPKDNFPLSHIDILVDNIGTFCYQVMQFSLKNVGATYQRAMQKSKTLEQHVEGLGKLFIRLWKFRLRLNLAKCTFGVKSGKLLGFIVNEKGIEVDPDKVKAIREMPTPKMKAELTVTCAPIFKLLKKNRRIEWNPDCQKAFEKIKKYLENPPTNA
ncbi:Retrovirus-related Pol polyprotein from transposon 17.6, partial [Mucuna pruriens]